MSKRVSRQAKYVKKWVKKWTYDNLGLLTLNLITLLFVISPINSKNEIYRDIDYILYNVYQMIDNIIDNYIFEGPSREELKIIAHAAMDARDVPYKYTGAMAALGEALDEYSTYIHESVYRYYRSRTARRGVRGIFMASTRTDEPLPPDTRYVRSASFLGDASKELAAIIKELDGEGVTQIIFDMRRNGGGFFTEAEGVSRMLLPAGIMFYSQRQGEPVITHVSKLDNLPFEHFIILVDENTSSAAELVAGALQDSGLAVVIGEKTSQKGTAQSFFKSPTGGAFMLSTIEFMRQDGNRLNGVGVTPDIITDEPMREAILYLNSNFN